MTGPAWGRSEPPSGLVASPSRKPSSRAQCGEIAAEFWAQSESSPVRRRCTGPAPSHQSHTDRANPWRIVHRQGARFRGNLTHPRNGPFDLSLRATPPVGHRSQAATLASARPRIRLRRAGKAFGPGWREPCVQIGEAPPSRFTRGVSDRFQPAIVRACARACVLSRIPGKRRRNSIAADNSPSFSNISQIAAASASVTKNIQA